MGGILLPLGALVGGYVGYTHFGELARPFRVMGACVGISLGALAAYFAWMGFATRRFFAQGAKPGNPFSFVESVLALEIVVVCEGAEAENQAAALGGKREFFGRRWRIACRERKTLAKALAGLRAAGFYFADQPHGWPPAAVFDQLREEGLVEGRVKRVTWRGPDEPVLSEE